MSCIRTVSYIINCGYARVTIYENSPTQRGCHGRKSIDSKQRAFNFRSQFSDCPNYGIPSDYFEPRGKDGSSQFDRDCQKILNGFTSLKWPSNSKIDRETYLMKFSSTKWSELSTTEKAMHSMTQCSHCYDTSFEYQKTFPLKPFFQPQCVPVVQIDRERLKRQGTKKFTSNVLAELNSVYVEETNVTFRDAILKQKSLGLEKKKSQYERKKEKRDMQKKFTKQVNESFAERAAITMLTEGESKRKYHRKRLAQSFVTPNNQPLSKKPKKHSPNFNNVEWDKENLEHTLQNWPSDSPINWSAIARDHGVPGGNAGQVVKEFANSLGLFTSEGSTPRRKPRLRAKKVRLPGSDISIPSNPAVTVVNREIQTMVESGRFTLGEQCAPYKLTKYVPINGTLSVQETIVNARKVPLLELRKRLLHKQCQYMRLTPTPTIEAMSVSELQDRISKFGGNANSSSHGDLCKFLCSYERSRSLVLWHDHATILKMGFLMVTVHTLYDPAVFLTDEEYRERNPDLLPLSIQSEVEQPEIYMLSLGGSSIEDQAAVIGDRLECLGDLSLPLDADNGVQVTDTLRFFIGDHPAAQFEQGTKQGGTYKCGTCGSKDSMFDDQAYSLQCKWRDLHDLQSICISGVHGREAGILKPFDNLKVDQLRRELRARGVNDTSKSKPVLREMLDNILLGIVRVPALLLTNPTQTLKSLNLHRYEVIASEPLHDVKGHLINIITELPSILPEENTTTQCKHLFLFSERKKVWSRLTSCYYSDISPLKRVGMQLKSPGSSSNNNQDQQHLVLQRSRENPPAAFTALQQLLDAYGVMCRAFPCTKENFKK